MHLPYLLHLSCKHGREEEEEEEDGDDKLARTKKDGDDDDEEEDSGMEGSWNSRYDSENSEVSILHQDDSYGGGGLSRS